MNYDDVTTTYDLNTWCVVNTERDDEVVFIGSYDKCVDFANKDRDRYFVDIWS